MGKSEDASFSSVDKSNFQLFKEKFKEKRVNKESKNDKNGRNCQSDKKKKKNFWSKWLTSVRGNWSPCAEARPPLVKSNFMATKTLEGGVDLYEIPPDPERKTSRINIKPDNPGLKAVTSECRSPSLLLKKSSLNKACVSSHDTYEYKDLEVDDAKINREEPLKTDSKSLTEDSELFMDKKEPSEKTEPLLTSAIFIHKDIDKMVESAVSVEPNLPRDYAESKTSEEISQKSVRINNVHVSFKSLGNKKDEVIKTFKTTSEPTWEERKKIIHEERLKENINCFVKQFVYLEGKDVIATEKKRIPTNRSSAYASRDLSREVSPEILVNIKPFKEYVSDDTVNSRGSMKSYTSNLRSSPLKHKPIRASENMEIKKVSENRTCPLLRSAVPSTNKNDFVHDEENSTGVENSILTLSPANNGMKSNWKEGSEGSPTEDVGLETSNFSYWDVYKTYSTSKSLLQVEVELGDTSFRFKKEKREDKIKANVKFKEVLQSSKSLDEVLDTLEDGDHDVIFQKNISQFKKKISVMPCLDLRKPKLNTKKRTKMDDEISRILVKAETPLKTEKSTAKWVAKRVDFSLTNSTEKKIEMSRSECLDLRATLSWKSEKILENIYLMLCESAVINQVLASRIEAKTFSFCQTLRELHDMQEKNNVAVIKIENPTNFTETLKKIELFRAESREASTLPIDPKESRTIATFLYINRHGSEEDLALTPNETGGKTRYFSENFQLYFEADKRFDEASEHSLEFPEALRSCQLNLNALNFKEKLSGNFLELSKEMKAYQEDENKAKGIEIRLTPSKGGESHETGCRLLFILNDPSYEYTVRIYDRKFGSLNLCSKSFSEPEMFKNSDNERAPRSDTALATLKSQYLTENKKTASSGIQGVSVGNARSKNDTSNICFDGFHVFYNKYKESLKADEEETSVSSVSSLYPAEKQNSQLNAEKKIENKEEEGKKIQKLLIGTKVFEESVGLLSHKSNSWSEETITEEHLSVEKRPMRRPPMSLKESDSQQFQSADEVEKAMKTESEALMPMTKETFVREKADLQTSLSVPEPLLLKQESEADKGRMFLLKKSGTDVKKEVVAAINLIKDMNPFKGETKKGSKQISLVILLSKN